MTDRIEPIGPRRAAPPVQPVRLTPVERERRRREREERRRRRTAPPGAAGAAGAGDEPPRLDLRA